MDKKYCDAVFEGGGVKGIGFAGAIRAIEQAGYEFHCVAGTSAGAIAASLLAAGYTGEEIEHELLNLDFRTLGRRRRWYKFRVVTNTIRVIRHFGVYKSDAFEDWLGELLARKGVVTFGDLRTDNSEERFKYRFQAIASNLTRRQMLILPRDLALFGFDADKFPVAKAVRMSMSIPLFYRPYVLHDVNDVQQHIVDGGLLSNYPVWLLDRRDGPPRWPTFGFRFTNDGRTKHQYNPTETIDSFVEFAQGLLGTMLDSMDSKFISTSSGDFARSILIPTNVPTRNGERRVTATYFEITDGENRAMIQNGRRAAEDFLAEWNFERWKKKYRNNS